jgi:hypothetical protein
MAKQQTVTDQNGHEEESARYEKELAGYLQERIKPGLNSGAIPLLARSIAKEIARRERSRRASDDADVSDQPSADADEEPSADADDEPSADVEAEPSADADEEPSAEEDDKPSDDSDDEPSADGDDEPSAGSDDEPSVDSDEEPSADSDEEPSADSDEEPSADSDEEPSADSDEGPSVESEAPPDFEADMHELQAELGEDWILSFSVHGDDAWLTAAKGDGSQHVDAQTATELAEAVAVLNEGGRSS